MNKKNTLMLLKKFLKYIKIYGFLWSLFKAVGRLRKFPIGIFFLKNKEIKVGIIGCGQFAFSNIAFQLYKKHGRVIVSCFDIDLHQAKSFSKLLKIDKYFDNFDDFIENEYDIIYIASNHSSHTKYTLKCLERGVKKIYVEKPISIDIEQLRSLSKAIKLSKSHVYSGFNRPFSEAVKMLRKDYVENNKRFFINMIIWAHIIDKDHWYRNPGEGGRLSGNLCHWLDLSIHMLSWKKELPNFYEVSIKNVLPNTDIQDNMILNFQTSFGDSFNITFGSLSEPFEGVSELIDIQNNESSSRILDFKRMEIDNQISRKSLNFFPKDAGHKLAILDPFSSKPYRDINEILYSTAFTLLLNDKMTNNEHNFKIYHDDVMKIIS